MSTKQQLREQQRHERKAALEAAQAKASRVRQLQVIGVVIAVLAIFGVVAVFALKGDDGATTPPDYNGCTAPMSGSSSHSRHSSTSCWLERVAASHAWARARLSVP